MTARRSIQALVLLGLVVCAVSGCIGPPYGHGYGPDYPAYGYAPYSLGWTNYGSYAPEIVVHHPWEEHHGFTGHHETFYHGPSEARPSGERPSERPGSLGHEAGPRGGATHGEVHH